MQSFQTEKSSMRKLLSGGSIILLQYGSLVGQSAEEKYQPSAQGNGMLPGKILEIRNPKRILLKATVHLLTRVSVAKLCKISCFQSFTKWYSVLVNFHEYGTYCNAVSFDLLYL